MRSGREVVEVKKTENSIDIFCVGSRSGGILPRKTV